MTVNEYLEKEGITANALASRLKLHGGTVWNVIAGRLVRPVTARKFNSLGIDVEVVGGKVMELDKPCELKDFQIIAMREYGNTIISREYSPEQIVKAFKKVGFKVEIRTFMLEDIVYGETHYVVSDATIKEGAVDEA